MLRGARPGGSVALIYTFLLCCAHYCHHGGLLLCARLQRFRMLPLMFSVLLAHVRFSAVRGCSGPSPAAVSTNAFTASARASEQHKGRFSQAHTHTQTDSDSERHDRKQSPLYTSKKKNILAHMKMCQIFESHVHQLAYPQLLHHSF